MLRWCYDIGYSMPDQGYGISRGMLRRCDDMGYSMLDQGYGISRGDVTMVL